MEESQVETQQAGTEKITEIHAEAKPETITEIHQKVEHAFFEDISYFCELPRLNEVGANGINQL